MPWKDTKKHNKPPSGVPAGGAGWGGAAKGVGAKAEGAPKITRETASGMGKRAQTPEAKAKREATIASAAELKVVLSEIALDDKAASMARIHAADKLLDRLEGKPTQRIDANIRRSATDFSDAELAAIAGEGGGESGVGEEAAG